MLVLVFLRHAGREDAVPERCAHWVTVKALRGRGALKLFRFGALGPKVFA